MQSNPLNKMAGKGTTLLEGDRPSAEEMVYCAGCSQLVCVPYGGVVACSYCHHETHWIGRHDHARRRKAAVPIDSVIAS